jgi:hypothetical protein
MTASKIGAPARRGVRYLFIGKSGAILLGYPDTTQDADVCHPDDIIASKRAANRAKDRESLPRLMAFRDYWMARRR